MTRNFSILLFVLFIAGCESADMNEQNAQVATLYRNGSVMPEMRLHFGSFDAVGEANDYNINNCEMTARLLNSNVRAHAQSDSQSVGFWCEPGPYREDGLARQTFDAEYPTDVAGPAAP